MFRFLELESFNIVEFYETIIFQESFRILDEYTMRLYLDNNLLFNRTFDKIIPKNFELI